MWILNTGVLVAVTLMSLSVGMVDTVPETRFATIYGKVEIGPKSMGNMKTAIRPQ